MRTYLYHIILIILIGSLCLRGEETIEKKEILPAKLTIIAIGPLPSRRFGEVKKGESASALLPPKPGGVPPRRLYFKSPKKKDRKLANSINISFNNPSQYIQVPPNKSLHLLRREGQEYSQYVTIEPLEPGSMTLILLQPTGKGDKRWVSAPTLYRLNLLEKSLSNKKLVILNLSRHQVNSFFDKEKKLIPPRGLETYESAASQDLHRLAATYGRDNKIIFNTALRLNQRKSLLIYILYDANPNTNDGRTVGLFRTIVNRVATE